MKVQILLFIFSIFLSSESFAEPAVEAVCQREVESHRTNGVDVRSVYQKVIFTSESPCDEELKNLKCDPGFTLAINYRTPPTACATPEVAKSITTKTIDKLQALNRPKNDTNAYRDGEVLLPFGISEPGVLPGSRGIGTGLSPLGPPKTLNELYNTVK